MSPILSRLLQPQLIWIFIPITWLIVTAIVEVVKIVQKHFERVAMIEHGMHPDHPEFQSESLPGQPSQPEGRIDSVSRETAEYPR